MIAAPVIRLARTCDARLIAEMSRDYIEHGLGWSWTPARVLAAVADTTTNIAVIGAPESIAGFGIMQYGDDTAHLSLLAVRPHQQQRGLGRLLMAWLEEPARVAGIGCIRLEARADNPTAIAFYRKLDYLESSRVSGYYRGTIDAVRLEKRLFLR
ncbi:MAG TPA: GNAT family N-acetyltransferase [Steroidobacteraceae bacterium]|jgi:ribosomal protein S18 acetylase RimI-like enzyme